MMIMTSNIPSKSKGKIRLNKNKLMGCRVNTVLNSMTKRWPCHCVRVHAALINVVRMAHICNLK